MKTKILILISMLITGAVSAMAQKHENVTVRTDTVTVIRTITNNGTKKDTTYMARLGNGRAKGLEKIENGVTVGYKSIENGVVNGYMKIQNGVVGGWNKIENKMVEKLFKKEGETVAETKMRLRENARKNNRNK